MEQLICPSELKKKLPLSREQKAFIEGARKQVVRSLKEKEAPLLVVLGPCSIHDTKAAYQYAKKLKNLAESVEDSFYLVMRAYVEKPRSVTGWKGLLIDPFLDGSCQIEKGLELSRELFLYLTDLKVPIAAEILDPLTSLYNQDLISWGCIGARTSSSQVHRQLASSLNLPIGFKNTTDGSFENGVNGILSAKEGHTFLTLNQEGNLVKKTSSGNPNTHLVLRGGAGGPNYYPHLVMEAEMLLKNKGLSEIIMIDCSHDNCEKRYENQPLVLSSIYEQILSGNTSIRGIMLESNLEAGSQPLKGGSLKFGVSITDPCLSFEETERALLEFHEKLQRKNRTKAGLHAAVDCLT